MKEKGLCFSCIHDSSCTFERRFPVLYCEEFYIGSVKKEYKKIKLGKNNAKKYK